MRTEINLAKINLHAKSLNHWLSYVLRTKFFVYHNVSIKSHDLRVKIHNATFFLGDKSEKNVKDLHDPH